MLTDICIYSRHLFNGIFLEGGRQGDFYQRNKAQARPVWPDDFELDPFVAPSRGSTWYPEVWMMRVGPSVGILGNERHES
jgi:hypothetical protein